MRNGNVQQAARDLIEAGKTSGSPQLNSFGPNMTLANELLEKGERDAVVEYLTLCRKFWTMGESKLDAWIGVIQTGEGPTSARICCSDPAQFAKSSASSA